MTIDDKTSRIITGPGDERLSISGMRVDEAMKKAQAWWNKEARHQMRKIANKTKVGRKFIAAGKAKSAAAILIGGDDEEILPSNLLRGLEWDRLERREKLQVVKNWHHHFVAVPMLKTAPTTVQ